ncbi:MAG: hypothetical protein JXR16_01650 [Bermanella sp.]
MAAIKMFFIFLLFTNSVFASNLTTYNKMLLAYENKIKTCKEAKKTNFSDQPNLDIDHSDMRTGLTYFIIKNDEKCSEKEKSTLITSINTIQDDTTIAEIIRFNAKNILELFKDSDRMLTEAKKAFMALENGAKEKLKKKEAYKRPFDPTMALEHYLNEK